MTAIVGESGCGKSTVVNMLIGAFRPQKGEVTVGGKQRKAVARELVFAPFGGQLQYLYLQRKRER
ncbi:MAG: ATP-binding cassette domain-containing protein [Christensenellaceae bacterium]